MEGEATGLAFESEAPATATASAVVATKPMTNTATKSGHRGLPLGPGSGDSWDVRVS